MANYSNNTNRETVVDKSSNSIIKHSIINSSNNKYVLTHQPVDPRQSHYLTKSTWAHRLVIKSASQATILSQCKLVAFIQALHRELSNKLRRIIPLTSGSFMLELASAEAVAGILRAKPFKVNNIALVANTPTPSRTVSGVIRTKTGIYLEIKFANIPREKFTWNLSQVNLK